jgi:hypothetical protein
LWSRTSGGNEICFGFLKYPAIIYDTNGKPIVETGTGDAWTFRNFVSSPDTRYRQIVKKFAEGGYLAQEKDEYKMSWTGNRLRANRPNGANMLGMRANVFGIMNCSEGVPMIKCPQCGYNIGPVIASHAGRTSTPAKAKAARENAKKGGWPKGRPRKKASAIKTKRKRRSR